MDPSPTLRAVQLDRGLPLAIGSCALCWARVGLACTPQQSVNCSRPQPGGPMIMMSVIEKNKGISARYHQVHPLCVSNTSPYRKREGRSIGSLLASTG